MVENNVASYREPTASFRRGGLVHCNFKLPLEDMLHGTRLPEYRFRAVSIVLELDMFRRFELLAVTFHFLQSSRPKERGDLGFVRGPLKHF